MKVTLRVLAITLATLLSTNANAWFFFFPIPNLAKPGPLQVTIDALEKSEETRALAFISEDKTFGAKYWVWGSYSGEVTQEEADRTALDKCRNSLLAARAQAAGGQSLYNFGDKNCELHPFTPNDGPKIAEAKKKVVEEAKKLAAAEDERRMAVAEEARKLADDAKRLAEVEDAKRIAAEDEAKRIAAEEDARHSKGGAPKKVGARLPSRKLAATASQQVDYDLEANKAARILGCQPLEVKVVGADGGNIQYRVACDGSRSLLLSCDPSGLCLQNKSAASATR